MKALILFLLCCNFAQAQKLTKIEFLDAVSSDICNEITIKNIKVVNENILGVQLIKALANYKSEVTTFYGVDYFVNPNIMESLGEDVGMHLGLKCPEIFLDLLEEQETLIENDNFTVTGKLNKVVKNEFLTFTIKEPSGKSFEFILLNSFETSYLLTDEILKNNDNIQITYYISELYNAKIGRYINYNVVTYIEKI